MEQMQTGTGGVLQWTKETQQDGQSSVSRIELAGPKCTPAASGLSALGSQGVKQVALGLCMCGGHTEGGRERMLAS